MKIIYIFFVSFFTYFFTISAAISQSYGPGAAVATCMALSPAEMVVGIEDITKPATTGGNMGFHWNYNGTHKAPLIAEPDWIRKNLGQIFGIALDGQTNPDIFVASTDIYPIVDFGPLENPAVYRLRSGGGLASGGYEVFHEFNDNGRTSGLGQVAYHLKQNILYVSDFETGLISIISDNGAGNLGSVIGTFDHGVARVNAAGLGLNPIADDGTPGDTQLDRLVWAVQVHHVENRLYYALGKVSQGGTTNGEVWSVAILPNGMLDPATVTREFQVTDLHNRAYGISDIAFSLDHSEMIISDREKSSITYGAHEAKVRAYGGNTGAWTFIERIEVGEYGTNDNSAGGVDYNYGYLAGDTDIDASLPNDYLLLSGNALDLNSAPGGFRSYGFMAISRNLAGGAFDLSNHYRVDLNGLSGTLDKWEIGDVEAYRPRIPSEAQQCLADAKFEDVSCGEAQGDYETVLHLVNDSPFQTAATNLEITPQPQQGVTVHSPANGSHVFAPSLAPGSSTSLPVIFSVQGNNASQICFDLKLSSDEADGDWCCPTKEVCLELPNCSKECVEKLEISCVNGQCTLNISNTGPGDIHHISLSGALGVTFTPQTINQIIPQGGNASLNFSVSPAGTNSATVALKGPEIDDSSWTEMCCEQTVTWLPRFVIGLPDIAWLNWLRLVPDVNADGRADHQFAVTQGLRVEFEVEDSDEIVVFYTDSNGNFEEPTKIDKDIVKAKLRIRQSSREELGVVGEGPFITEFGKIEDIDLAKPVIVFVK